MAIPPGKISLGIMLFTFLPLPTSSSCTYHTALQLLLLCLSFLLDCELPNHRLLRICPWQIFREFNRLAYESGALENFLKGCWGWVGRRLVEQKQRALHSFRKSLPAYIYRPKKTLNTESQGPHGDIQGGWSEKGGLALTRHPAMRSRKAYIFLC